MLPLFGGALAAFERLRKDIETQPTIDNTSTNAEKPSTIKGSIEFRDVAFTYPSRPDHPVLNNISLKCDAGMSPFISFGSFVGEMGGCSRQIFRFKQFSIAVPGHD